MYREAIPSDKKFKGSINVYRQLGLIAFTRDALLRFVSLEMTNLEIIESGLIETLAVRCATISKAVSSYNRAYHCTLPDATNALLTYRLATKNSVAPTNTMAKAEKN